MAAKRQPDHEMEVAHTAELGTAKRRAARALLDDVFGAEMTDADWDHALGGLHVLAWEARQLVGHSAVVQRQLIHGGRALRTGYVEGVAVRADRQGRGYGAAMMDVVERIVREAYELGALGASEAGAGFYAARGWRSWRGRTWALTPAGRVRTAAEDNDILVMELAIPLDLSGELTCEWREGDVW